MSENENVLNSDKTLESLASMTDEKQTNYMLQRMIAEYLNEIDLPSINTLLEKEGQKEEPGVLTTTHIKLLQCIIKDFYKANGGSIEISAKQKGIKLVEGTLSDLEKETLDQLLADYCKNIKDQLDAVA